MAKVIPAPDLKPNGEEELKTVAEEVTETTVDEAAKKEAARKKRHRRRMRALFSLLFRTVALAVVIYVLFFHIVGITMMPSRDMYPRLDAGDLLLYYRLEKNLKAQDLIVFSKTMESSGRVKTFVCRIVAAPGDTVEVTEESGLRVNGNAVIESNIFYPTRPYDEGVAEYPIKLGEGEYFVLADQRNGGMDSRYFGVVKAEEIQGVVITMLRRNNL